MEVYANLLEVNEIVEDIKSVSGKKAKEKILADNSSNKLLMDILYFMYNDDIKTNIAKKKLSKKIVNSSSHEIFCVKGYMDYLQNVSTGTDVDVCTIHRFIESQPVEAKELLEAMATKSLKIGVTAKTVNGVLGYNFIPTFDVMLSHDYNKHGHKIKGHFTITPKLDGTRLVAFNGEDGVKFFSRNGKEFEGLVDIIPQIQRLPKGFVYDGELLATNDGSMTVLEQYRLTQSLSKTKGDKRGLEFHIFDLIPIEKFKEGIWKEEYSARRNALESVIRNTINICDLNLLDIVEAWYRGDDKEKIREYELEAYELGLEGIMISQDDAPYICDRSYGLQKLKEIFTADIEVLDVREGEGKYKGTLGVLVCDYKGYELEVSGMSDAERDMWWKNPNEIVGQIIKIKHNGETNSQTGNVSVRFPRYEEVRWDKDTVSYE